MKLETLYKFADLIAKHYLHSLGADVWWKKHEKAVKKASKAKYHLTSTSDEAECSE